MQKMTTRKERGKYRAVCYSMLSAIRPKIKEPICFVIKGSEKLDYAGLYEQMEGWHKITVSIYHNQNNTTLFETVAHELEHAKDAEKGKPLIHDANFWKRLDRVLVKFGLEPTPKKHKKECIEMGKSMGNGG